MGQTIGTASPESVLEDTVDTIHYEFKKHTQSLMEIGSLTYEEFNACLARLNDLYDDDWCFYYCCCRWQYFVRPNFSFSSHFG